MKSKESVSFKGVRVALVSSYVPRNCGIARFSFNLRQSLLRQDIADWVRVLAINNTPAGYPYGGEVIFEIDRNHLKEYKEAANYINLSGFDVVNLQHEFGLFGGDEGLYIAELLARLKKPVVTTLHTVLKTPTEGYRKSLLEVMKYSDALVVLSATSAKLLQDEYKIPKKSIHVIHHGVPDVPFQRNESLKTRLNIQDRFTLFSCGLLGPGKGIELVLDALPEVVKKHPEVIYIILGATHPEVIKFSGEAYRNSLQRKVHELGLQDHVMFRNAYVTDEEMLEFMQMADLLVTPYPSKEQVSSGNLADAMGVGMAVVSTPFYYAEELLAEGRGQLIDFGDVEGLSKALKVLIEDPKLQQQLREKAYAFGRQMTWDEVSKQYHNLFAHVTRIHREEVVEPAIKAYPIPEVNLNYLKWLTDDTGIFQHTIYGVPDRQHGYCTDDVSRALIVATRHFKMYQDPDVLSLARTYMGFMLHAQRNDGLFQNFFTYERKFEDVKLSEDTFGRCMWALGYVISHMPKDTHLPRLAQGLMDVSIPAIQNMQFIRAKAYTIIGLFYRLMSEPREGELLKILNGLADDLVATFNKNDNPSWHWFDNELTYANAILPEALLKAYLITENETHLQIGLKSLDFLIQEQFQGEYFDFVGNRGWYSRGKRKAVYGQQPIDAAHLTRCCLRAYQITQQDKYQKMASASFEWFLGRNRLGKPLYNFATGACADGLDEHGISLNPGAESVICFLMAHLSFVSAQSYWEKGLQAKDDRR